MTHKILLPWPPKELSPNKRLHWRDVHKAKALYRMVAFAMTQKVTKGHIKATKLELELTFHEPTKRKRDMDNMLAQMKAGIDGIADAIGVDDSKFSYQLKRGMGGGRGIVEVNITVID